MAPNHATTTADSAAIRSVGSLPKTIAGDNQAPPSARGDKPTPPTSAGWLDFVGLPKIVDRLYQGVCSFGATSRDQVGKLSTAQKVAGAVALAGVGYLVLKASKSKMRAAYRGSGTGYQGTNYRSGAAHGALSDFRGGRA